MQERIPEADWKVLRQLHPVALERCCQRVLGEVERIVSETGMSSLERYRALFEVLERRDEELARAFDDMRRSQGILRLLCIRSLGLLTEDEFSRFSAETRERVGGVCPQDAPLT